jgi:hypothetical protein
MKSKSILVLLLITGLSISCEKNKEKIYSFSGKAQKGPFITGTNVTINELNPNLGQTGKSFTTTISSDDGSFKVNNIELNSDLCLLTANGFYFSEIYGELSAATLSLQAITDLSDKEFVNINVLTHLIKDRIENLVSGGMNFQAANEQAKSELLIFLGAPDLSSIDFEDLDISENKEYNAVLLAFSIIVQRYTMIWNERPTLTAELTQLLSKLNSDFKDDGQINNQNLIDTLLYNISQLNQIDIRNNIEAKYINLGYSTTIPNFEKYIAKFQEKFSDQLYTNFFYPDSAPPEPVMAPDSKLPNLLVPSDTVFIGGLPYSIAAIIPLNSTLTIKFSGNNSNNNYTIGGPMHGWELINDYPNGFTLNSQRQNELMTMLFYLESPGSAEIEYYENTDESPTFTKTIKWE